MVCTAGAASDAAFVPFPGSRVGSAVA
jgi:hypothetical protein